jgi:hypothetical protein
MNEYYTPPDDLAPFTKAKTSQINDLKDSVDVGFDNLPTDLSGLKTEIINAREDKPSLLSRLQAAEAATAADVLTCQEEVVNCQAEVVNCQAETTAATTQANRAEAIINSFLNDPVNAVVATSTTSLAFGTGSQTLTVETDKGFLAGMWVVLIDVNDPENFMRGYITEYTPGTGGLVVTIVQKLGTGTISDWVVAQTVPMVPSDYSPVSFKGMVMAEMF